MISGCIGTSALSCTPKPKTIPFQFRVKIGTHVVRVLSVFQLMQKLAVIHPYMIQSIES
jgi:hypothetical protein